MCCGWGCGDDTAFKPCSTLAVMHYYQTQVPLIEDKGPAIVIHIPKFIWASTAAFPLKEKKNPIWGLQACTVLCKYLIDAGNFTMDSGN